MKRNENKVPGFDEIIFENRNREYGAYLLRKQYKSATSISILAASAIASVILIILLVNTKPGEASGDNSIVVVATMDSYIPEPVKPEEIKPPVELSKASVNVAPVVVTDSAEVTDFIPTAEEIIQTTTNGNVNDTVITVTNIPEDIIPVETKIFIRVEEMPEFPGGERALLEYIAKHTKYPPVALENHVQGRVFLKFVVAPDGSAGMVEILKGVDPLLDEEAERVISTLPKFKPGKQGGVPVPVWYSVPVLFRIDPVR